MTKKNDSGLPNEQKVAQDVREVTEEEILAGVTGGVEPIKTPIAVIGVVSQLAGRSLPFGLVRPLRTLSDTLNVSPTSAFKPYERPRVPDLNQPASSN